MRTWILKKISFRDAQLEVVGEKKKKKQAKNECDLFILCNCDL